MPYIRMPYIRTPLSALLPVFVFASVVWANHTHMEGGPFLGVVVSVAIDRADPSVVYVAAHGGGVFYTKDGGESWTAMNAGLPDRRVFSLLQIRPSTFYLGTDHGIFQRTNGNPSWQLLTPALLKRNVRFLALGPDDSNLVYAATDQGVFSAKNNQWRQLSEGLTSTDVRTLAIAPSGAVFAGTFGGIYKKRPNRNKWMPVDHSLEDKRVRALAIDRSRPDVLYAGTAKGGVFKTVDGGKGWQTFNRGLLNSTVLSLLQLPDGSLYAGTIDGIYRTRGGANQWAPIGDDLPFTVTTIAFDPTDPRRLYAGSGGRLYRSADAGQSWREVGHRINYFGAVSQSKKD